MLLSFEGGYIAEASERVLGTGVAFSLAPGGGRGGMGMGRWPLGGGWPWALAGRARETHVGCGDGALPGSNSGTEPVEFIEPPYDPENWWLQANYRPIDAERDAVAGADPPSQHEGGGKAGTDEDQASEGPAGAEVGHRK